MNKNKYEKKSIADDIEKMRQRREDRKNKNDDKNKYDQGKFCDQDYEKLIRKKKREFDVDPEEVVLYNIAYNPRKA